jgi:hypothetical protein
MNKSRTVIGVIISPLFVPLSAYVFLSLIFPGSGFLGRDILFTCIVVGLVAYAVCLAIGLPIHFFFNKSRKKTLAIYACIGLFAGCLSSPITFALLPGLLKKTSEIAETISLHGLAGFLVGLVFWTIAVREPNEVARPDR